MESDITILIPTSPIKSHPDTKIIDKCIDSIRNYLPTSRIIIMADGVRPEQEEFTERYQEYLLRLQKKYPEIDFHICKTHRHQAGMTKDTLPEVKTPLIFFVEHDWEMIGPIPILGLAQIILSGKINLVRFCLDEWMIPEHAYMMLGDEHFGDIRITHTYQWSQRPQLCTTQLYIDLLNKLPDDANIMIEEFVYGLVTSDYEMTKSNTYKLAIYTPGMKRTNHLDGREGESKFDELMNYGTR